MDAVTWLTQKTQKKSTFYLLVFLATFPVVSHILGRIVKQKWWLNDFDAVICGADYLRRGLSPYDYKPFCEGLQAPPYVYAPQVAEFFVPIINTLGLIGTKTAYTILLVPLMLTILWYALVKSFPEIPFRLRIIGYAVLSGSALSCGNIILPFHALLILLALRLEKTRWLFLLTVLIGSLIKPVLLTYLIVFVYEKVPLLRRAGLALLGAVVGIAGYLIMVETAGPLKDTWQAALTSVVMLEQPGYGFFGWVDWIGITPQTPGSMAMFGVYMVVMAAAGFVLAEALDLNQDQRVLLALGVAMMLNPRLMAYDMLYMPTMMAMLVVVTGTTLPRSVFVPISWVFVGTAAGGFILANAQTGLKPAPVAVLVYALMVFALACAALWKHRSVLQGWLRQPLPLIRDVFSQKL